MPMKRCPYCGEKYSDTYWDCPFCEEENALREGEKIRRAPRRGRRTAHGRQYSLLTPTLIVLILIMAGLLVYLLYGDKIGDKGGKEDDPSKLPTTEQPENPVTPVDPPESEDDPQTGVMPENPEDMQPAESDYDEANKLPSGLTLSTTDFSLFNVGETATIRVSGGSGSYTWISENDKIASVDGNGKVTAVSGGTVNVLVTDGNKKGVCIVRVKASGTLTPPSGGESTPTTPTTPSTTTLQAGDAVVVNAGNGVRVRSGPSTNHEVLATITNGGSVRVVESAGDGWYKITFANVNGVNTTGYMKGEFLTNR